MNDVLFFICIALQVLVFFVSTKIKMWLLIGAVITSLILCFTSPVGFLWLIVSFLCALNAFLQYMRLRELKEKNNNLPRIEL